MRSITSFLVLVLVTLASARAVLADDPVLAEVDDAVAQFEASVSESRVLLITALESAVARTQKTGDLSALKAVQKERDDFVSAGALPTSVSTRVYERRLALARRQLESAYEAAVRQYTRDGNVSSAEIIQDELESFLKTGSLKNPAVGLLEERQLNAWSLSPKSSRHWSLRNGVLRFDGGGGEDVSLATKRSYKNFTLRCEWRIGPGGDSGIYLRGLPQIQIWDHTRGKGQGIGSGGLYNNKRSPKAPTAVADKPIGQWNSMTVTIVGDQVTVTLNGKRVVDKVTMENSANNRKPLPVEGPILLQAFHTPAEFRRITVSELP